MKYDKEGTYSVAIDSSDDCLNLLKRIELVSDVSRNDGCYPSTYKPLTLTRKLFFSKEKGLKFYSDCTRFNSILLSEDEFLDMCSELCPPTINGYRSSNIPWYNHVSRFSNA
jgi:hypothetical protein